MHQTSWHNLRSRTQNSFKLPLSHSKNSENNSWSGLWSRLKPKVSVKFPPILRGRNFKFKIQESALWSASLPKFNQLQPVAHSASRTQKQEAQLMLTNPRNAFRGQSRSPNIVPFHMLGIVSCQCTIATFSLRQDISRYSTSKNIVTMKSESEVTQGHWKWYHSIR